MKPLTFCRKAFLSFLFLFGAIFPSESFSFENPTPHKKCSSGGCFESTSLDEVYSLLVFVSFSMPDTSLLSLAGELENAGGAFVVRGLPNSSFAEFSNKLECLRGLGVDAPILIDPDSFETYEITQVPTIVLKGEETFDKVSGNIPISYALEIFSEKGEEKDLAREIQCISFNICKQCKQSAQVKQSIPSKQRIQSLRGSQ